MVCVKHIVDKSTEKITHKQDRHNGFELTDRDFPY